jgi:CSLREA domain-containing protein
MMAVVTVTTLADTVDFNDGVTSLREAIFATNVVPGADAIRFAPSLTASGPAKILLTEGELKITDSLEIDGPGADILTIDASGSDPTPGVKNADGSRVFDIEGDLVTQADASIRGLTLTGGDSAGGGVRFSRPASCSLMRVMSVAILRREREEESA